MYDEDVAQADTNEEKKEEPVCSDVICVNQGGIAQEIELAFVYQ